MCVVFCDDCGYVWQICGHALKKVPRCNRKPIDGSLRCANHSRKPRKNDATPKQIEKSTRRDLLAMLPEGFAKTAEDALLSNTPCDLGQEIAVTQAVIGALISQLQDPGVLSDQMLQSIKSYENGNPDAVDDLIRAAESGNGILNLAKEISRHIDTQRKLKKSKSDIDTISNRMVGVEVVRKLVDAICAAASGLLDAHGKQIFYRRLVELQVMHGSHRFDSEQSDQPPSLDIK